MRKIIPAAVEYRRLRTGQSASTPADGNNGAFTFPPGSGRRELLVLVSDGGGWEHASVSVAGRTDTTPSWNEMQWVKETFWLDEELVLQFHPPKKDYVNYHPGVLHLWRPLGVDIPLPPKGFIA